VLLGAQQAVAHADKGPGQLGRLVAATGVKRIREVPSFQRRHSGNQVREGLGERVRDEEDQRAPNQDRYHSQSQEQAVELLQESSGFLIGFQHAQPDLRTSLRGQFHRGLEKVRIAELKRFRLRNRRRRRPLSRDLRVHILRQRAGHDAVAVVENHFTVGDSTDLRRDPLVNLVSDYQEPQQFVGGGRPEVNRLQENLIQVPGAEPPSLLSFQGRREGALGNVTSEI